MSNEEVARAFSCHRFEETFDHLTPDTTWNMVGEQLIEGRDAVIETCRQTDRELAGVATTWLRFVSTGEGDVVAVDAIGRYEGPDGVTTVSSCDIYEFDNEMISALTSYAVELSEDADDGRA